MSYARRRVFATLTFATIMGLAFPPAPVRADEQDDQRIALEQQVEFARQQLEEQQRLADEQRREEEQQRQDELWRQMNEQK
jgi:hypothetical protein